MLRHSVLTLTSAIALTAAANAADIYSPAGGYKDGVAPPSWTGFYVGALGAYAHSDNNTLFGNPGFVGVSPEGVFVGGLAGYNWQGAFGHRSLVLGIETDIQGSNANDKHFEYNTNNNNLSTYEANLDWFGTIRGRIGYAFDTSLVYFTGGFAYGGLRNAVDLTGGGFKSDETGTGYTIGAGFEHKVSPALSIKFEYQYLDLGKSDPVGVPGAGYAGVPLSSLGYKVDDESFHTVRVSLNYQFLQGYQPLK
jgi:outer membrane immunogenic protein